MRKSSVCPWSRYHCCCVIWSRFPQHRLGGNPGRQHEFPRVVGTLAREWSTHRRRRQAWSGSSCGAGAKGSWRRSCPAKSPRLPTKSARKHGGVPCKTSVLLVPESVLKNTLLLRRLALRCYSPIFRFSDFPIFRFSIKTRSSSVAVQMWWMVRFLNSKLLFTFANSASFFQTLEGCNLDAQSVVKSHNPQDDFQTMFVFLFHASLLIFYP